jgi:glycosyltransferase involved in cell wall biosynthesis
MCMVVHGPYPVGEPRVSREAAIARDAGWHVDVISLIRDGEPTHELVDGIHVVRLRMSHRRGTSLVRMMMEYGFFVLAAGTLLAARSPRKKKRYDIVHVHAPPDFLIAAALIPKVFGSRVFLDIHDLSSDMFAMRFANRRTLGLITGLLQVLERLSVLLADALLTVHEPYRRELIARGADEEKIVVVMNSLDERILMGLAPLKSKSKEFRVVYHGTLTPSYGVDLLLRAAASVTNDIPNLRVELYGEGDAVPGLIRLADALGISDRVTIAGTYLEHQETLAKVMGADVGIIPNRPSPLNRFALSSKLFEYVALGITVISADLPTIRAHFGEDEVLYFRAGDYKSLADKMRLLATKPEVGRDLRERARTTYKMYRWHHSASRYRELLQEVVGGHQLSGVTSLSD